MSHRRAILVVVTGLMALMALACGSVTMFASTPTAIPTPTQPPSTPLPPAPVQPGAANPDEPIFISGYIPFTSPFFMAGTAEPFVLLEDETGFVKRDLEFEFPVVGQAIGPVEFVDDQTLSYSLALPAVPLGTPVDVDNDDEDDPGVQVFAVAYWSNTWGDPFLEERDGTGWSTAYASTITDAERDYEIVGGILIVWAPDDEQDFPVGFGDDGLLFTEDDPTEPIPAGYNIVNLDEEPFHIYKEAQPRIDLYEGESAVNDYSGMSYGDAFDALFDKVSREYPFTEEKGIDWEALYDEFQPRIANARSDADFYRAMRDFAFSIPDGHVGGLFNRDVFFDEWGGGFGLVLVELSDGRVIVTDVLSGTPGDRAGIKVGAEIVTWDGKPVGEAIDEVVPNLFSAYSTEHTKRLDQVLLLTHVPSGTRVEVTFSNPGSSGTKKVTLQAVDETASLFQVLLPPGEDLNLPVEGEILEDTHLGYIRITGFHDDYNLMARLWDRYIDQLNENEVPGLIIDIRDNGGGSLGLSLDFAGYFFDEEFVLSRRSYYNELLDEFEYQPLPARIEPGPMIYEGAVAVLVGPTCVSACEGFAYALTQGGRVIVVGHYPTAGAYGEVGRGQYDLPGDLSIQFPTGRPETPDGKLLIEGKGVVPDIVVPVTEESALGKVDAVLEAAVKALLDKIGG
jgi:C-terminal processing protease CtpA/Prc